MYKDLKLCRVCGNDRSNLRSYLDLGNQPLANSLGTNQAKYPLEVLFCPNCALSQLSVIVNPDILYKDYPYHSSVSQTFKNHCNEMANTLIPMFEPGINEGLSVLDIASNDGCLLEQFKSKGFRVTGVEPAKNLADEANLKGIPTIHGYWCEKVSRETSLCDVITATNVFAHVDDIKSFLNAVKDHLRFHTKGIFVLEVPYLVHLISNNQFDTIYHEHLSYFLLKPLNELFEFCGMSIFRVEGHEIHGGTIRVYGTPYDRPVESSVHELLRFEEELGFHDFEPYLQVKVNVEKIKTNLVNLLQSIKKEGKKVMGYGASAKGTMLLNYCGIDRELLSEVVDETPAKQGKTIPGCNIPIVSFDCFDVVEPDYILLLAWNFQKELIQKTPHHHERRGKYIVPIPEVKVI